MKTSNAKASAANAAELIANHLAELGDWRGDTLKRVREIIHAVDPEVLEEVKWRGVPVWSHDGILCTGESYKQVVKLTFARGASLPDPKKLFNSSLEGNVRRAIDLREGDKLNVTAFKGLIRSAVMANIQALAERKAKNK